ncbi:MAG: hypothetical protein ABJQ98_04335 [Alloalcanivorax venustensis]|jgi:hypothetical protein|uniref:DUF6916 family protein n=2 Tax=Pseudomonadota TaxID=1224 RepID=UPI000C3DF94B|nr:hypothetical protein [Alcanivorax sp.]QVL41770.1 MAG: hypothetical protein KFB92_09655 [Alcanivorax sp.]|tara:strand:- start:350 stop:784 length:435 start_codon:yes stop_codon:yes gene_type:complete
MDRRAFLVGVATLPMLMAGCGGDGGGGGDVVAQPTRPSLEGARSLRAQLFRSLEGQTFYLGHPTYGVVDAVLEGVADHTVDETVEQFVLSFSTAPGTDLPEGRWPLEHPTGGRLTLYMQPSGSDSERDLYRAVFSQINDKSEGE